MQKLYYFKYCPSPYAQVRVCCADPYTPHSAYRFTIGSSIARPYLVSGFTLVELIVTIAVFAIIAVVAVPSFSTLYTRKKLEASVQELSMKVSEARIQAVSLRDSTGICLSSLSESECSNALGITDPNKNRIFVARLENGVTTDDYSATSLKFRNNGSIAASAHFGLSRNELTYCVNVGLTGDTTVKEGACT